MTHVSSEYRTELKRQMTRALSTGLSDRKEDRNRIMQYQNAEEACIGLLGKGKTTGLP